MAFAQSVVKLTFSEGGHRAVWVGEKPPEGEPDGSLSFDGKEFELKASSTGPETRMWVLDEATNNFAVKKLTDIGGTWAVKPEDYTLLGKLVVSVVHDGEPVESASVSITDGVRKIDQILDSSSKGQIVLYGLKPGTIKVTVTYRSEGKTMDPLKQSFDLGLKRSKSDISLVIAIADPVATIQSSSGTAPKTEKGKDTAGETKDTSNPIGRFVVFILVFGGVIALVFFGLKWMKNNPTLVQNRLDQMGVQTPKGGDPGLDPVAQIQTPTPLTPAPPQKIMLDDADPSTAPIVGGSASGQVNLGGSVPTVGGSAPIFDPRLVGESGMLITLTDGSLTVGREGAHAILLPGESTVSRNHAEIICSGKQVTVKDTGSTNGTFVNGVQVHDSIELKPGDSVQFGSVRFRFEV